MEVFQDTYACVAFCRWLVAVLDRLECFLGGDAAQGRTHDCFAFVCLSQAREFGRHNIHEA